MFTTLNGSQAATTSTLIVHQYNEQEMVGGLISETTRPLGRIEFLINDELDLCVKVGDDTLRLPLIKVSVEFISNPEHEWMISKKGAEFSIDKQNTNMQL